MNTHASILEWLTAIGTVAAVLSLLLLPRFQRYGSGCTDLDYM